MSAIDTSGFLQQAHRNNWQMYLSSLQPQASAGWDLCVLTASDERQAAMYRRQLELRREAGLLPRRTGFEVVADPQGRRIGSGGATLRVLAELAGRRGKTLIIHSGGDSRRLPHASAVGKLFARVPRVLPDGRASTVFDEFLIAMSGLAGEAPGGTLVASGDVLLIFDHLQVTLQRPGVIGVAAAAPVHMGSRHGVYVSEAGGHIRAYLHKPPRAELERWGALHADGTVQIDTGLVWFDEPSTAALVDLAAAPELSRLWQPAADGGGLGPLNLYADLLLPLAGSTTLDGYLADTSDGPATAGLRRARRLVWERLRGIRFGAERLQPAVFLHFGTSREYWAMVADSPDLARTCGWVRQAAAHAPAAAEPALVNAVLDCGVHGEAGALLAVDSRLGGAVDCAGPALIAGVVSAADLALAPGVVVHQLPVRGGFVTRVFGMADDPKLGHAAGATFVGRPWAEWMAEAGLTPETIWPHVPPGERSLWTARLYPVSDEREESLALALPLQRPGEAPAGWREQWQSAVRLSLAESFAVADGERLLADAAAIEDHVAARRFLAAVEAERPAAEARALLGQGDGALSRRCRLCAQWLGEAAPLLRLRGYKALAEATGSFVWEERAFRDLALMIQASVAPPPPAASSSGGAGTVTARAAARIDFGGGWSDTPPFSIERGGTVLNAALTLHGAHPIVAEAAWLEEPRLVFESRDIDATLEPRLAGEVLAYSNPADPFALQKAAVVMQGIVPRDADPDAPVAELLGAGGRGLRLATRTGIPRGSGLGTSSIMAGAVLGCLTRLLGREVDEGRLFQEVLCLEQMLTTGGGWQDQIGGLVGGVKMIATEPGLPQRYRIERLALAPEAREGLDGRLLLVYTGQQRLAKNLLRAVMGRWLAREPGVVSILEEITRLAREMRAALLAGDITGFGVLLSEHWALNKRMDPGCTNPFIDTLFETMAPYIDGGKLAGAGGGGFAIVVARDEGAGRDLAEALARHYPGVPVGIWPCAVPESGLLVETG